MSNFIPKFTDYDETICKKILKIENMLTDLQEYFEKNNELNRVIYKEQIQLKDEHLGVISTKTVQSITLGQYLQEIHDRLYEVANTLGR